MNKNYKFDSAKVKHIAGEILNKAYSMLSLLIEQKYDAESIYYHIRWYLNGARDVMIIDNSISENDFNYVNKVFDDFIKEICKVIDY